MKKLLIKTSKTDSQIMGIVKKYSTASDRVVSRNGGNVVMEVNRSIDWRDIFDVVYDFAKH